MARKEYWSEEEGVFTLNEISVGKNGNNYRRADVQLVQFFLRDWYKRNPGQHHHLPQSSRGKLIKIDGICGNTTNSAIYGLQKFIRSDGGNIVADGLVDVAHSTLSTITSSVYTIHYLNRIFRKYGDGNEHHGNLENHPDIIAYAPELQSELKAAAVGDEF